MKTTLTLILLSSLMLITGCQNRYVIEHNLDNNNDSIDFKDIKTNSSEDKYPNTTLITINGTYNGINVNTKYDKNSEYIKSMESNVKTLTNRSKYVVQLDTNYDNSDVKIPSEKTTIIGVSSNGYLVSDVNDNELYEYRNDVKILNLSDSSLDSLNFSSFEFQMKDGTYKYLYLPYEKVYSGHHGYMGGDAVHVNLNDVLTINGQFIKNIFNNSKIKNANVDDEYMNGNMDFTIVILNHGVIKIVPLPSPNRTY